FYRESAAVQVKLEQRRGTDHLRRKTVPASEFPSDLRLIHRLAVRKTAELRKKQQPRDQDDTDDDRHGADDSRPAAFFEPMNEILNLSFSGHKSLSRLRLLFHRF